MRIAVVTHNGFVWPYTIHEECSLTIVHEGARDVTEAFIIKLDDLDIQTLKSFLCDCGIGIYVCGEMAKEEKIYYVRHNIRVITGITGAVNDVAQWIMHLPHHKQIEEYTQVTQ